MSLFDLGWSKSTERFVEEQQSSARSRAPTRSSVASCRTPQAALPTDAARSTSPTNANSSCGGLDVPPAGSCATIGSRSGERSRTGRRPRRWPATVWVSKTDGSWKVRARSRAGRSAAPWRYGSPRRRRRSIPSSACTMPVTTSNNVVLPAPFGPAMPKISPRIPRTVRSSTAANPPYRFTTPSPTSSGRSADAVCATTMGVAGTCPECMGRRGDRDLLAVLDLIGQVRHPEARVIDQVGVGSHRELGVGDPTWSYRTRPGRWPA